MADSKRKQKIWELVAPTVTEQDDVAALVASLGISPVLARLLCRRGYHTPDLAARFFACSDTVLHRPFLMKDMDKAVECLQRAVESGEKIVIYGDYDVDGVTSVSLLYLYLTELGATVGYYIPSRMGEGYGLSAAAIDKLAEEGVTCILTVDTGITANEEARYAAERGIDMIITDHHECRLPLPEAVAVVNPHRPDCPYPFKELAGVGVAFKLVTAYESRRALSRGEREVDGVRRVCERYADLMAIGTIADVMPIVDENRVMVKYGIEQLRKTERAGLVALIEEATAGARTEGSTPRRKKISASFIGFTLAPRLNAAGRMSDASLAVELLLSNSQKKAAALASEICDINLQRQVEENRMAEEVFRRIDEEFDLENTKVLVLEADHWRQGVIGIVASRVTERYGLPSILITFDNATEGGVSGQDVGKGSGRSVKGVNLVEALASCEDLLVKFGGHELAAGLSVRRDRVADFRARINEYVAKTASLEGGVPVRVDMELPFEEITLPLAEAVSTMEPFGTGNPTPRFLVRDVVLERVTELGGGKHLKLTVSREGRALYALLFSTTRFDFPFGEGEHIDLLCSVDINEFRDVRSVQLTVQDVRYTPDYQNELEAGRARYAAIAAGDSFDASELVLPDRELLAHVYVTLRREYGRGRTTYTDGELFSLVNVAPPRKITYPCLRYMLEIFNELQICGVAEPAPEVFQFEIYSRADKANIEKSTVLKRLRTKCRRLD